MPHKPAVVSGLPPSFYPPVGFYFKVNVTGITGINEGNFQEVTGLNVSLGIEEVKEGGENQLSYRLPIPPKYSNLILKRGMVPDSSLIVWARKAVENFIFKPTTVTINLLDYDKKIVAAWSVMNAYPVGINVSDFKSMDNSIVVETLELAFTSFKRLV